MTMDPNAEVSPGGGAKKDFAALAVELGYCTPAQIEEARAILNDVRKLNLPEDLASVLTKRGYLTSEQAAAIERARTSLPVLGGFELLEKVGQGGMGAVFRARQVSMDRVVAVKILPRRFALDPRFRERFLREARLSAQLSHPNLINAITCGEEGGHVYFAMEFVVGKTARQMLQARGKLQLSECLPMLRQVGEALGYAHSRGLIHRDVKPSNIMLARDGFAKLCDLGVAAPAQGAAEGAFPASSAIVGTPHYMAPEQVRGEAGLDGRADIYALGATFYHLVSGRTLFSGTNPTVLMAQHVSAVAPALTEVCPGLPEAYGWIVAKMVAKSRDDRYATVADLLKDLDAADAGRPVAALGFDAASSCEPPPARFQHAPPSAAASARMGAIRTAGRLAVRSRRRRGALAVVVAMLALLAVGTAIGVFYRRQLVAPPLNTAHQPAHPAPPQPGPGPPEPAAKAPPDELGPEPKTAQPEKKEFAEKTPLPAPETKKAATEPSGEPPQTPPLVPVVPPPPPEPPPDPVPPPPDPAPLLHARFLAELVKRTAKTDLAKADQELRGLAKQDEFAPIAARTAADLRDLALAARFEQDGLKALAAAKGEIELPPDLARAFQIPKARIDGYDSARGLSVSAGRLGLYIPAASLPPARVAQAAGVAGRETDAAMYFLARGLASDAGRLLPQMPAVDRPRMEERLEYLRLGEAEIAARLAVQELAGLAKARQWAVLQDKLNAFAEQHAKSLAAAEHVIELIKWKGDVELRLNPLRRLFHAATVRMLPDGAVELTYDFTTAEQLLDFDCSHAAPRLENGALLVPEGGGEWSHARLRAPLAALLRLEATGVALQPTAAFGVAVFLPGRVDGEGAPRCVCRAANRRANLEGWHARHIQTGVTKDCNAVGAETLNWMKPVTFSAEGHGEDLIWSVAGFGLGQGGFPKSAVGGALAFFGAGGLHAWSKIKIVFKPPAEWLPPGDRKGTVPGNTPGLR